MTPDFSALEKSLFSLEQALSPAPKNDRERDGAIQRFEYTFELAWKAGKRALAVSGIESNSPRSVIRDCAQQGWIDDAEKWLAFLNARNSASHAYEEKIAVAVFGQARDFAGACRVFLERLRSA